MIRISRRQSCLAVSAAVVFLAGCGNKEEKAATQVAAKVNKEEISVHQINYVLTRSGNIPADQVPAASKQVLEKLIDQDLLMQKAVSDKLDRDPNVMQTIESNRRQVLAQAYLEKVAGAATKPTAEEVKDYYEKHPELFSHRRIYRFQQLSIAGGQEFAKEIQQEISSGKGLPGLADWAKAKNLQVSSSAGVKSAEQLPLELLPRLSQMKDGQIGVLGEPKGVTVLQLVASQEQAMDEKTAVPYIEQYLLNRRKSELAEKEVKQLRAAASIEYMGDFNKKDEKKEVSAPAPAPAQPGTEAKPVGVADDVAKAVSKLK